jgi:membrane-anchored glycerophosphoryl diester phosphodiesterase (GDPDase)
MGEIDDIQAELSQLKGKEGGLDSATHETITKLGAWRHSKDRSFIVRWIVYLYCSSIAACLVYLIIKGIYRNEDVFTSISEVIKVAVVPIVTLVIGYYFGTAKNE